MTALRKLLSTTTLRLFLVYSALFALTAFLVVGTIFWRTNDLMTEQVLQVIAAEVRGLREQYRIGGLPLLMTTVAERSRVPGNSVYMLGDDRGRRLAGNLNRVPPELSTDTARGLFRYARAGDPDGRQRMGVGVSIRVDGDALLIVGRDIEDQREFARSTQRTFLIGFGLVSLLGLAGAILVSRRILRKVDDVTAASRRIMAGELTERLPVGNGSDELDRLSASLNEMLERIEQLLNGLREVSDNIAHDLKTPLTRLRNNAEAALASASGPPAYREGLEQTIEQADELIKTFNALLTIARMEAGAVADRLEPIDVSAAISEIVELYEPVVEEAGLGLEFSGEPGIVSLADRQLLGQAMTNLIENAIKYAGPERGSGVLSPVTIKVAACATDVVISVGDRGPGIPASDRERVLKRFVRLDSARTRPGSGLGLSLVAAVARLHGGSVRLEDNEPGLRVVLVLPRKVRHSSTARSEHAMERQDAEAG